MYRRAPNLILYTPANAVTKIGHVMEQDQDKGKKEFSVAGFLKDKGLSDKEVEEFISSLKKDLEDKYSSKESPQEHPQKPSQENAQAGEEPVSKIKVRACVYGDSDILNDLRKATTDPASLDWLRLFNEALGLYEQEGRAKEAPDKEEGSDDLSAVRNFSALLAAQEMSDIWDLLYDLLPVRRMISDRVSELSKSRRESYSDDDVKLIGVAQVLRALDNAASGEEFKVERKSVRQTHLDREVFYRAVDVSYAGEVLVRIADVGYVAHCSRVLWYNPALPYLYDRVMVAPSGTEPAESMDMEHLLFWHAGMTGKHSRFLNDEELDEFLSLFFSSGIVKGLSTQSSPARGIVDSMVPEARSKCIYAAASGKPLS